MLTGWRYRFVSAAGTVCLVVVAVLVSNLSTTQSLFTTFVPVFNRLEPTILSGSSLWWALALSVLAIAGAVWPLYKPRPRRILDTVFLVQKRVLVGGLTLATLGYFQWSHRLPRATLVMIVGFLVVVLPGWFLLIRGRPTGSDGRTVIIGDDLTQIKRVAPVVDTPVIGYLCPTVTEERDKSVSKNAKGKAITDGGIELRHDDVAERNDGPNQPGPLDAASRLGGLSRLEDVLIEYDIETAVLAFRQADRAEFFGALDACHEYGVDAKVHRQYADSVLVSEGNVGELVDVDLEPWDPLDHILKRIFDFVFAIIGLVVFTPLMMVIAAAIKLDSPGPIFYSQNRTAGFGETFPVYKFRSMVPEGEDATPTEDEENNRITRVGQVLRRTHLDELPQLWSIFTGDMSVVGPRAAWTEEEALLEQDIPAWRKRWFVKPGLTGLAQINDAKSTDPDEKLRYDLEYIRRQSFWFDVKIVIRQIWKVLGDVCGTIWR
ncbi:lipopolysaccharide/colanic/teichoic acid biosynthesis glycosyltransferase [Natrinema hispanicum]|uniref:Lipopolysaccharide/colanic/teichoic acid biosynthesis glycosyltransferase n=1 Tax=Natrinema hispanicum TaxID=392421 RepID=A0A482YE23_9EURY|nr:sugar transferase [Natrinema hispanicum]RZV10941.1 lipopolysaccharide/colanic/teichoic acid biosynthesis glycosyltransferase [Natrinema hispanicum]